MAHTAVKPPAAAAAVPVAMSSLYSWPGSRRWVCRSMRPGTTQRSFTSMIRTSLPAASIQTGADALDPAVAQEHVRLRIEVARRIDDPAAAQADGGHEGSDGIRADASWCQLLSRAHRRAARG